MISIFITLGTALACINLWFLFESFQLSRLEKKDPLSDLPESNQSSQMLRSFNPLYGTIYKVYAAMKASREQANARFELHVAADVSDSPRLQKHVGVGDITHVMLSGSIYKVTYIGSDVKDACTDFLKDRCDIFPNADLIVNVYALEHAFTLTEMPAPLVHEDIIEHHIWAMKLS